MVFIGKCVQYNSFGCKKHTFNCKFKTVFKITKLTHEHFFSNNLNLVDETMVFIILVIRKK